MFYLAIAYTVLIFIVLIINGLSSKTGFFSIGTVLLFISVILITQDGKIYRNAI